MSKDAPVSMALVRNTARYYWRMHRPVAGLRAMFSTVVLRHGYELCQECGRRYSAFLWWSPSPLWLELVGSEGGLLCPRCFNAKADKAGIRTVWTPMVTSRDGVATTNWWLDPVRDRLLMGEPDPGYHRDGRAQVPQGPWGPVAEALEWAMESPYPSENRGNGVSTTSPGESVNNVPGEHN